MFDPSKKFHTWIFTIVGNMCKTEYRNTYKISISADEYEISDAVFQENLAKKDFPLLPLSLWRFGVGDLILILNND